MNGPTSLVPLGILTLTTCLGIGANEFNAPAHAQIVPDGTLGVEASRVERFTQRNQHIQGGAIRSTLLFHSFSEFNVPEGHGAYFDNPLGVESILGRVTGASRSDIMGRLGVLGDADLFLVNPNGFVFGPNASLDITGSFMATTADGFVFDDEVTFSAVNPQPPQLLTISVTPGLQWGNSPGAIATQAHLMAGDDLTLAGGSITNTGHLTADFGSLAIDSITGDVTLSGGEYQARQEMAIASAHSLQLIDGTLVAGGELLLTANNDIDIRNSRLSAERDMVFRAPVRRFDPDSTFTTGGYFITQDDMGNPIDFLIPHEQVIVGRGDVELTQNYTGQSLYILAGGAVTTTPNVTNITINGGSRGAITETIGDGAGGTQHVTVRASDRPTIDIRAGIDWDQFLGGFPGNRDNSNANTLRHNTATGTEIGLGTEDSVGDFDGVSLRNEAGRVLLTNQHQPNLGLVAGNIRSGTLNTSAASTVLTATNGVAELQVQGGDVWISSRGSIELMDEVDTSASAIIGFDEPETFFIVETPIDGNGLATATAGQIVLMADGTVQTTNLRARAIARTWINDSPISEGTIHDTAAITTGGDVIIQAQESINTVTVDTSARSDANVYMELELGNKLQPNFRELRPRSIGTLISIANSGEITFKAQAPIISNDLQTLALADAYVMSNFPRPIVGLTVAEVRGDAGPIIARARGGNINVHSHETISIHDITTTANTMVDTTNMTIIDAIEEPPVPITVDASAGRTHFYTLGAITTGDLNTSAKIDAWANGSIAPTTVTANSGEISFNAQDTITANHLDASTDVFTVIQNIGLTSITGNSGDINFSTQESITVQDLETSVGVLAVTRRVSEVEEIGSVIVIANGGDIRFSSEESITGSQFNTPVEVFVESIDYKSNAITPVIVNANGGGISLGAQAFITTGDLNTWVDTDEGQGDPLKVTARAGNISLDSNSGQIVWNDGTLIRTNILMGDGHGGDIQLSGESLQLTDTLLTTTVTGTGDSGNILVDVTRELNINGSRLLTGREPGTEGDGAGGKIEINAGAIELTDFSFLNTATLGVGDAGPVTLTTRIGDIVLLDSSIFSLTTGEGNAGRITLKAAEALRLENNSVISTAVALGATGQGGDIFVEAPNGLFITGTGTQASNVEVGTRPSLTDNGQNYTLETAQSIDEAFSVAENPNVAFATEVPYVAIAGDDFGDYYSFKIDTVGTQVIFDIDEVQYAYTNLVLNLLDSQGTLLARNNDAPVSLGEEGSRSSSDPYLTYIFNEPGPYFVEVAWISSDSFGGPAFIPGGSYNLNISRVNDFLVNSGITTQTRSPSRSGNITINAPSINLQNGSQISTETLRDGRAGNITLNPFEGLSNLTINVENNDTQISASTTSSGQGGNILIAAPESIVIRGDGRVAVETTGSGKAGILTLTTRDLTLNEGIVLTAASRSPRGGAAGDINVTSHRLILGDDSRLSSETESGDGGNINLNLQTLLRMKSGSRISTSAGTAGNGGNGGNITIALANGYLLADAPNRNIDITANAFEGSGGQITIATPGLFQLLQTRPNPIERRLREVTMDPDPAALVRGIFGFNVRSRADLAVLDPDNIDPGTVESNDITAISQNNPDLSGEIVFQTPDLDPIQGLIELPIVPVKLPPIDAVCTEAVQAGSEFTFIGRGGIPSAPTAPLGTSSPWEDWYIAQPTVTEETAPRSSTQFNADIRVPDSPVMEPALARLRVDRIGPPPLTEAQGLHKTDDGTVQLVLASTTTTPTSALSQPNDCRHLPALN